MAGKYDDMTFKAFNAARKAKGAGKVFTWKKDILLIQKKMKTNYKT